MKTTILLFVIVVWGLLFVNTGFAQKTVSIELLDMIDKRTDKTWPSTFFIQRITGKVIKKIDNRRYCSWKSLTSALSIVTSTLSVL